MTVEPSEPLTPGEGAMATVRWSGFNPGSAYIYVCRVPPAEDQLPLATDCYGETQVVGATAADGTGEAQFEVRSVITAQRLPAEVGGQPLFTVGANADLICRAANNCGVVVTECSSAINAAVSARSAPYQLAPVPAGIPPVYIEQGLQDQYSDDPYVSSDAAPFDPAFPEYGYGVTYEREALPPPPDPPPPPSPVIATGPTVRAIGGDIGATVYGHWGRAAAGTLNLNFGATSSLDYVTGLNALLDGSVDFALSGAPPTAEQIARLAAEGQSLVYVPISATAVGLAFRAYPTLPLAELRVSPRVMAGTLDSSSDSLFPPGSIGQLAATFVREDQQACASAAPRDLVLNYEPGPNEAALTAASWLTDAAGEFWVHGATNAVPPSEKGRRTIFQSSDYVAAALYTPKQTDTNTLERYARIGLVDAAWARHYYQPMAAIQNAAGAWVSPSPAAALATLETSTVGDDNIVNVDYGTTNPAAYPMVTVMYAVAPVKLTGAFSATDAENVRKMLSLFVSDEGQQLADQQGLVPLPDDLRQRAQTAIAKIGSVAAPPPPTAWPSAEVNASPDPAATTTVAVTGPATTATTAPAATTTTKASTTSRPSSNATQAPNSSSTATTSVSTTTAAGTTTATSASGDAELALPAPADGGSSSPLPPDVFSTMFGAIPFSPGLPTLGAAGGAMAVVGQGLGIWRSQLRRTRLRPPGR